MIIIKQGLVLCGGGTKGSYQAGAIKALTELNIKFDIITGTSIGALNGCLVAQHDEERLFELWDKIEMKDILAKEIPEQYDIETIFHNKQKIETFLRSYVKEKGADISPFKQLIKEYFNADKLMASSIIFGCMSATYPSLRPVFINKAMMNEKGEEYLLASASCFPIFPIQRFDGKAYIDGGYVDNLPIDYAIELGATHIVAIDLSMDPNHFRYIEAENVRYIFPKQDLGPMICFDKAILKRNQRMGYLDVYKAYDYLAGHKYTFEPFKDEMFANKVYNRIQKIDIKIIRDSLRSNKSSVFETLREILHKRVINYDDVIFGLMDNLMDIADYDIEQICVFPLAAKMIVESYAAAFADDYELVPKKVTDVISYIKDLDKHSMIEKLIHLELFEHKRFINSNILLTLLPFEEALANFVILLKERFYD